MPQFPLVSALDLHAWMQDAAGPVLVIDTSFDLTAPQAGQQAYLQGHLPGAQYLDLNHDLSGVPTGRNGRHPLPSMHAFAQTMARCGADDDTRIVVYDRQGAMFAARLWWLLRRAGHAQVFVLDGGWQAWQAAGLPVADGAVAPARQGHFSLRQPLVQTIDYAALRPLVVAGQAPRIVDARAADRFRGENETLDPVGGHIPGARNHFFRLNLDADGRFLPAAALREQFERVLDGAPADAAIMQCGSGVTACHNLLALEVAGLSGARLYPGSWSEWSAQPDAPIATGAP